MTIAVTHYINVESLADELATEPEEEQVSFLLELSRTLGVRGLSELRGSLEDYARGNKERKLLNDLGRAITREL